VWTSRKCSVPPKGGHFTTSLGIIQTERRELGRVLLQTLSARHLHGPKATCQTTCALASPRLSTPWQPASPKSTVSYPCSRLLPSVTSCTLPEVARTVCTRPDSASPPMCAFIPKCHGLPFLLECISASLALSLFLVEVGAGIRVASTTVPAFKSNPRWTTSSKCTAALKMARACAMRK
jgi:hypothetical protein